MKISQVLKTSCARFALVFGKTTPLRVTHVITHRCNLKCTFCKLPVVTAELSTEEIKTKMQYFKKLGTLAWGFTGGEALTRKDLPELVKYAKRECKFITSLATNGTLFENFREVGAGDLDFLMVSLEGDKEKNDSIRGAGSYERSLETLRAAKTKDIKVISVESVLQDNNIEEIKYLTRLASELDIYYGFQPLFDMGSGLEDAGIISSEKRRENLVRNIEYLHSVEDKRMLTSKEFLRYCMNYGKMGSNVNSCFAGRLYCQMMPDGSLQNCWWRGGENKTDSFNGLEKPKPGCYCWPQCHAEYSFIFTLNLKAVMNILKKFKF